MSLPSIQHVAREMGVAPSNETPEEVLEEILIEAMRRDLDLAMSYLHKKAHESGDSGGSVTWTEDPNSPLGKQLIRVHASDALRPLAEKHFCHGKKLSFYNCCNGVVGERPENAMLMQIHCQDGTIASADC